jgi:hypothetical protein
MTKNRIAGLPKFALPSGADLEVIAAHEAQLMMM